MLTKIAKRIQSRLSRKGLKVESKDIRTYLENSVSNVNNITDQETNQATDYFMSTATKLTVIQEDVEPMLTNEAAPEQETLTNNNSEALEATPEISICVDVENGNIQPTFTGEPEILGTVDSANEVNTLTTGNNSHPVTSDQPTETLPQSQHQVDRTGWYQPAPLATATKSELVSSTAQSLGIALSTQEVETIATNINTASEDLSDSLEEIKGAIIAFISYKANLNSQKIDDTLTEISQVAADKFNQNSEQFTDGLRQINQQMQQQRTDFKSKVKATLSAFAIPAIKAG